MICIRKISAIMEMKAKALMSKNFLIMMLFSIGYGYLMKTIIGEVSTYALSMAVLFNIAMALYVTALLLAEEKEKNTLRVLMTSSVRGIEYFLGTVFPIFIEVEIINVILALLLGVTMSPYVLMIYVLMTFLATLSCTMIGMIFGIFAKNQMNTSSIITPAIIILMLIPMFSELLPFMKVISECLFTGIVMNVINKLSYANISVSLIQWCILSSECIITLLLFLILYKRNGFEA
ncbi:ABC transporter permease [Amedibacterium intestinale]|uniref:ABC transporter permease n=1 Tax=Amedibacterium intestinale TaxID=2583452 RepID=UPI000E204201